MNADYGGIVQPSQQNVAPCVKGVTMITPKYLSCPPEEGGSGRGRGGRSKKGRTDSNSNTRCEHSERSNSNKGIGCEEQEKVYTVVWGSIPQEGRAGCN